MIFKLKEYAQPRAHAGRVAGQLRGESDDVRRVLGAEDDSFGPVSAVTVPRYPRGATALSAFTNASLLGSLNTSRISCTPASKNACI